MKYQVIKHNKSGTRQEALYESLESCKKLLTGKLGAFYSHQSYVGGFPIYKNFEKGITYSIQGWTLPGGPTSNPVVCSLGPEDSSHFFHEPSYWACARCKKVQRSTEAKELDVVGREVCFPKCE